MSTQEYQNELEEGNTRKLSIDEIPKDGFYFLVIILRYKWFIIIISLLTTVASAIIAFNMENWYSSTISAVPPKSSSSLLGGALGNISSTLKEFGMTKVGGKGDNNYSFMVILESRTVKDSIIKKYNIAKEYEMDSSKMSLVLKAFDENVDVILEPEGNYTITIYDKDPERAMKMVNDYLYYANNLSKTIAHNEAKVNKEYLMQRIKVTEDRIAGIADSLSRFSRGKMLFSPEQQATSVAKSYADLKAEVIREEVSYQLLSNRLGKEDPNTKVQKEVLDEMRKKVYQVENQPGFAGNFSLRNAAKEGYEFIRMYAELETFTKVKSFLLPMLEEEKLNEIKETQSLFVVDVALPADKKSKPKRSLIIAGAFAGSLFLSIAFVLFYNNFRNFRRRYNSFKLNNLK